MPLVNIEYMTIPTADENGRMIWVVGLKLGDRDPAILSHHDEPLIFDTADEAREYIKDELE